MSAIDPRLPPALAGSKLPDQPVPGKPGCFTDGNLSQLGLALLNEFGIFYCLLCNFDPELAKVHEKIDRQIGFNLENVWSHIAEAHKESIDLRQEKAILDKLEEYAVWKGPTSKTPAPIPCRIVPAFSFLRIIYTRYACGNCPPSIPRFISVSPATKTTHLRNIHGLSGVKDRNAWAFTPVNAVQSFQSGTTSVRYFQVDVSAMTLPNISALGVSSDEKAQVSNAYVSYIEEIGSDKAVVMGPAHGLTRESYFLHKQGWSEQVAGYEPRDLVALVSGSEQLDGLDQIPIACRSLFALQKLVIKTTNPSILRAWIDKDREQSNFHKLFDVVKTPRTEQRYCRVFSQLICLVLETYRRLTTSSNTCVEAKRYVAFLTWEQKLKAQQLLTMLDEDSQVDDLACGVQALAVACFAPTEPSEVTKNKYNDIVYVFVMLKSILMNGSFKPTKDMVGATMALQYMFCSVLLYAASLQIDEFGADPESTYASHLKYLAVESLVYPFGQLKTIRSQMAFDVSRNKPIADFSWTDQSRTVGVYKGTRLEVSRVPVMACAMLLDTEDLLYKKVLFDIPPVELGYNELDIKNLQDLLDDTRLGYSVWTDQENKNLSHMRRSLAHAFIRHEKLAGHFWSKKRPNGDLPCWNDWARHQWLDQLGDFSLHLMACFHVFGGQPRRGAELCQMHNINVQGRPRNLMVWDDLFMYMLGYSKTLAITGLDRTDVHALPPRINRMIGILNSLIRPLAVQWVKELYDESVPEVDAAEALVHNEGQSSSRDTVLPVECRRMSQNVTERARKMSQEIIESSICAVHAQHSPAQQSCSEYGSDDARADCESQEVEDIAVDLADNDFEPGEFEDGDGNEQAPLNQKLKPSEIEQEMTFSRCGRVFNPDDLSKLLAKYTKRYLGKAWGIKAWRHICIAIQRAHLHFTLLDESPEVGDTIMDLQAGHSARSAATFYAVEQDNCTLSGSTLVARFVEASKRLHAWLDGQPVVEPSTPTESIQNEIKVIRKEFQQTAEQLDFATLEILSLREQVESFQLRMTAMQDQNSELLQLVKMLVQTSQTPVP
ncbi:hypothetical protein RhiJN_08845 [Ceratobasidium sp. AG-Ba]|nr:hypothetical protein RhiJN_08845 [Ceratobasidium sp. AG-Ba]